MNLVLWFIAVVLVLVGLAGIIVPALPGTLFVFLGLLTAAWIDGFQRVGWVELAVLGCLTVLSLALDFIVTGLGTKRSGASRQASIGAAIGAGAGMFFGIAGIVIGPFLGAAIGEYLANRDISGATRAGKGAWLGLVAATAVKTALAFSMIGLFIVFYLIGS